MGRSHTVGQCPGQGWTLSRRGSCQGRLLGSRASPFVAPSPVLNPPQEVMDTFLTTGEILGSGLNSDPARDPGQTLCHRQRYLFLTAVWHWDSPCLAWTS